MEDIALIVNTISTNYECLKLYIKQLNKYFPQITKKYIFTDTIPDKPKDFTILNYKNENFRDQFLSCLTEVKEPYCIYNNEDYLLYDHVQTDKILLFKKTLEENSNISYVRFTKGLDYGNKKFANNLFLIPNNAPYSYTQQATLWKTNILLKIYQSGPPLYIGAKGDLYGHFEVAASDVCNELKILGLYCYYGENKRGIHHYDSIVYPHVASALIKGKWNLKEYPKELAEISNNLIR